MKSLVSILVPVYNRKAIIAETLESAISQTYKNIEIIVVDNASTDGTWQVIQYFSEKDKRIKAFRNLTNLGPVRNWLRCVEEAKGEFGKILWSDDLISPDFIEKTLSLFNENVGFVYTGAKVFTDGDFSNLKTHYLLKKTGVYDSSFFIKRSILNEKMPVSPGCAIFRMRDIAKNLWLNIPNKVDSDFSMHAIGNDLLLFLLTAKDYKKIAHVAEPLSFFRAHEGSISISSKSGKLPLHYALVRMFFSENYDNSSLNKLAAQVKVMLWEFRDSKNFKMENIDDFCSSPVKVDKLYLFRFVMIRIFFYPVMTFLRKVFFKWK